MSSRKACCTNFLIKAGQKMKRHKVYAIEFNQYTNCMHDTVWCEKDDEYLDVGKGTFLILEEDIDKYRKFGHGIKTLTYVGDMLLGEETDDD